MAVVSENHYDAKTASQFVSSIVFSEDFSTLCRELVFLYKNFKLSDPEKEAFHDAFYSIYTQMKTPKKALTYKIRQGTSYEGNNY